MCLPLPVRTLLKFLDLFGKSKAHPVKSVRTSVAPADDHRLATARKIDAIESEITAEFDLEGQVAVHTEPAMLLEQSITEASILYASRQTKVAERLLLEAVDHMTGEQRETIAWMMLLELASFEEDQRRFDDIALRYAERFETSPPQWRARSTKTVTGQHPALAFRGKLLASSRPALAQFEQMAQPSSSFNLDLRGITEIDHAGCAALLALFKRWEVQGKQVAIVPAPALMTLLQSTTQQDRQGVDDSVWRLLIELLRISGDERAYEDACVNYSMTFELSPPPPLGLRSPLAQVSTDLCLPPEIVMPVDALIHSLRAASEGSNTIMLDGQQLRLVEFNAAAALLEGVSSLAKGKPVEWRHMPYLVSTLLQLVGGEGRFKFSNRPP